MRSNREQTAGFTLAEVVVGVLLLGLSASLLGRAISDSLRAYEQTSLTDPYQYPMRKVREQVLQSESRTSVEEGGELEIPVTHGTQREGATQETTTVRARWEAEVSTTRVLNVYKVDLVVDFQGGSDDARKIESSIIAYRTTWGDVDEVEQLIESKEEEFRERQNLRGEDVEGDDSE